MYFRQLEDGYICSEGVDGIPVRMLLCPVCSKKYPDNPEYSLLKYMGFAEEQVTVINPLNPEEIIDAEDEVVECATFMCLSCHNVFKFAARDIFWRSYITTMKYEVNAAKYTYLEAILKDAGISEEQAFLFMKEAVESRLSKDKSEEV
ncbi:MAG TPA: hypothetical protein PLN03_12990 [Spirochaetota bacterium]|nr:hypothetical protein [Spirochaetota bacterium]